MILTASADKTARLWDVETGKEIRRFVGHTSWINCAVFSPDGRFILTASGLSGDEDNTARLWNVETGKEIRRFEGHSERVNTVAFSPTSGFILTGSDDGSVRVWDTATGHEIRRVLLSSGRINAVSYSPDGRFILTGGEDYTVHLISATTGQEVRSLVGHTKEITSVVFSQDGYLALTGSDDRTARLWEVATGKEVRRYTGQPTGVSAIAFSRDEQLIATGGGNAEKDNIAYVWRTDNAQQVRMFEGYVSHISAVVCSSNGRFVLTGSGDKVAHLWDMYGGQEVQRLVGHTELVRSIAFSPDNRNVLTGSGEYWGKDFTARLWDIDSGKETRRFIGHGKPVEDVTFSPDGRLVATASSDNTVRIWSSRTGAEIKRFQGDSWGMYTVSFSRNQRYILGGGFKTTYLWNAFTGKELLRLNGGLHAVFSPDEQSIFAGNTLWDASTGKKIREFGTEESLSISSAAFSPDGRFLLFATDQGPLVWDVASGKEVRRLLGHSDSVYSAAFSPDGQLIVSGGRDGTTRLWSASTGVELLRLISFRDGTWVTVDKEGRFDTNDLENIGGLKWIMPDDPLRLLPLEIFTRDYYEPRLLARILKGNKLPELPPLTELNRIQPQVGRITVIPQAGNSKLVDVKVDVSSVAGQCLKGAEHIACGSGVYDLRLYRDGQLVGQSPTPVIDAAADNPTTSTREEQLQQWRQSSVVKTKDGRPITAATGKQKITFTDIRLPQRSDLSQVEFTAYAFNEDRVKSATSEPVIYKLQRPRPGVKRRAYIITIGVDATSDPSLRLGFAPNGAREVENLLSRKLQPQYEVINVQLISEYKTESADLEQDLATKSNIQAVLNILSGHNIKAPSHQALPNQEKLQPATPDDLIVIYIASHGYADPNGKFYIVPSDIGDPAGVGEELLNRCLKNSEQSSSCQAARDFLDHTISSNELTQWLQIIDAGQMVLILDSCHSAAVSGPNFKPGPMGDAGFGQLSYDKRMLVLAATQAENVAWGTLELGDRSLLTYALIKQQQGEAQPFNFRRWLSEAEKLVPDLYRQEVKERRLPQEPALFDFSKRMQ
jgi:WD40 repeat protein